MASPTEFDYLLNRMENAAHTDRPHDNDYASFRAALMQHVRALEKDAERYRMLRDNGYLDRLCGDLHPCDEPRRMALTDAQVDRYAEMHASRAVGAA